MINDQAAREAALNTKQSFIVQAPAGSGKTELLTQRILKLLAQSEEPEAILAITFTRKAASEMRTRILNSLNDAKNLQDSHTEQELTQIVNSFSEHKRNTLQLSLAALAQDKKQAWNILENPNRLQLKTIDSFCSSIVFQLPILAELGGQVAVSENPDLLFRQASQAFIASLEEDKPWSMALARVLTYLDIRSEQLEAIFISMLHRRPQWLPLVMQFSESIKAHSPLALKAHMEAAIQDINGKHLGKLKSAAGFTLLYELDEIIPYCSGNAPENSKISLLQGLAPIKSLSAQDILHWKNITNLLLTNEGAFRKPNGIKKTQGFPADKTVEAKNKKSQFQNLLLELANYDGLRLCLQAIETLPDNNINEQQLTISADICECLIILLAYLKVTFQEHNAVDFSEIQLRASKALSPEFDDPLQDNKSALLALDTKIKHILIDEYQDTSNSQLELLENLISQWQYQDEGKSLFLVGDPMQSIYRFREANVGIFIEAQERGVKNFKLKTLSLSTNFRSELGIVDWVNNTFSKAFPKNNDYQQGAIAYSSSDAFKKLLSNTPSVEYHLTEISWENTAAKDLQSEQIVQKIQTIQEQNNEDSIAILVRSKHHAQSIITLLKEKNIPYQGVDMDPLTECPHIINLINLSAALLHQGDELAWYGLLRSSIFGLSNTDLLTLSIKSQTLQVPIGLLLTEPNDFEDLTNEAQQILARCLPVMVAAIFDLQVKPFSFVVESCWLSIGGPASLFENQHTDCDMFFSLLREIEKADNCFDKEKIHEACNRLFASSKSDDNNPVFIMSIHKAKGLEFDHVFLPSLEKGTRSDTKKLLNWDVYKSHGEKNYLLLAPLVPTYLSSEETLLYDYLGHQEKQKANNENIRLFYVACTRAKKNLYLYASLKQGLDKKSGEISIKEPSANSLLSLIWSSIEDEKNNKAANIFYYPAVNEKAIDKQSYHYQLTRIAHDWKNIPDLQKNNSKQMNRTESKKSADNTIESIFQRSNSASVLGTLVHACLKQFAESDAHQKQLNWLSLASYELYHRSWKKLIHNEGIYETPLIEELLSACTAILKITFADNKNAWIFDNQLEQSQCEQSIFYIEEHAVSIDDFKHYIVDRSFILDGVRWIIDYKTTEPKQGQPLEIFLNEQENEHNQQLRNYAHCYQQLENLPQQLAIYFPKLAKLHCLAEGK